MAMKMNSTFPKAPGLETHYRMVLWHNQDTRWEGGESYTSAEIYPAYSPASLAASVLQNSCKSVSIKV